MRVYNLPDDEADLDYEAVDHTVGPVGPNGESAEPDGYFTSLAHAETAFFVVARDGTSGGAISRPHSTPIDWRVSSGSPQHPRVLERGRPVRSPSIRGRIITMSSCGQAANQQESDSRLTMYSPTSGKVAITVAVGLRDIVALAFSPSADLYAVDSGSGDAETGGVYRLEAAQVDGRESCRAVKIAAIANPSSLTFTPDGVLYVTAAGDEDSATDVADAKRGSLVQIKPNENVPPL